MLKISSWAWVWKKQTIREFNKSLLSLVENLGLLVIAIVTVFVMWTETLVMVRSMQVTLTVLLLIFLYLEVLAMVGLYYLSEKLPVRFPLYIYIYIGMAALARYLILDTRYSILDTRYSIEIDGWLAHAGSAGSILMLTLAVFLIRYGGHVRFAYPSDHTSDLRQVDRKQDWKFWLGITIIYVEVINISSINNHKQDFKVSACTKVQYDALDNIIK